MTTRTAYETALEQDNDALAQKLDAVTEERDRLRAEVQELKRMLSGSRYEPIGHGSTVTPSDYKSRF